MHTKKKMLVMGAFFLLVISNHFDRTLTFCRGTIRVETALSVNRG